MNAGNGWPAAGSRWVVWGMVGAVALLAAGIYLRTAVPRVLYPYDLDFIEDAMLMQAWRVARHQPVYLPPNAEFVPQVYMPLFTWLGGLLLRATGPQMWPLRALSLAATLLTAGTIAAIARRERAPWPLALAGAALYLGGYRLVGGWFELARVDALFVLLALAGMALAVYHGQSGRGRLGAGILMGLALLAKQNGLFLGSVVGAYLLLSAGRRAWQYWLPFLLVGGGPAAWLQWRSGGWFLTYVQQIAYASPVTLERATSTLRHEIFGAMGFLAAGWALLALLALWRSRWRAPWQRPWPFFAGAALVVSVGGRASVGGNLNNLMPAYAFLCLVPALLAAEWSHLSPPWSWRATLLLAAAVAAQFALSSRALPGSPARYRPTPAMRAAGDRLIARLAAVDGEVLVMLHPYYALLAGKTPSAHMQTLWHARQRGTQPLPADLVARLQSGYYALIISDESRFFEQEEALQALLRAAYRDAGPLPPAESPPELSGLLTRPRRLYLPRSAQASP